MSKAKKGGANATADSEQAQAGAGASGANTGVTSGQSLGQVGAGTTTTGFSETGHKSASDIAAEEALSRVNVAGAELNQRAAEAFVSISTTLLAGLADNAIRTNSNASDTANLVNKMAAGQAYDMDQLVEAITAKVLSKSGKR